MTVCQLRRIPALLARWFLFFRISNFQRLAARSPQKWTLIKAHSLNEESSKPRRLSKSRTDFAPESEVDLIKKKNAIKSSNCQSNKYIKMNLSSVSTYHGNFMVCSGMFR